MRILPLAERPDLLGTVAAWGFGEWGHLYPEDDLGRWAEGLRANLATDAVPLTLVAVDDGGRPLGTVSLEAHDIDGDPRTPWLASLFVRSEARGRGIGTALVGALEATAARLGTGRLWLFTPDRMAFYAALGWRAEETRDYRGQRITVMSKSIR